MKNWKAWAEERKPIAKRLDVAKFLEDIAAEIQSESEASQGEAFLELAAALRTELAADGAPSAVPPTSAHVAGLLRLAEEMLHDDPLPAMMLATHFFYDCQAPDSAYPHALRSVEKAKRQQELLRQTTGELIRICLQLERYEEIEPLLLLLTEYEPKEGALDVFLESDFLSRLPAGTISPAVMQGYRNKLSSKRS